MANDRFFAGPLCSNKRSVNRKMGGGRSVVERFINKNARDVMPKSLLDRISEGAEALVGAPDDFDPLRICQSLGGLPQSSADKSPLKNNERTKRMRTITNIVYSAIALFAFACLPLSSTARAVDPAPDGGNGSYQPFYTHMKTVTLSFYVPGACITPPPDMVGWYPGDGNADDISVTGNNGTLQGGATFASGMVYLAFSLNGTDAYVQAAANAAQDPTTAGSQDAWVYFNQTPSAAGHIMEIIGKGSSGSDFDLQADPDDRFRFYIAAGNSATSTTVIQTGLWYHVAGTWNSTSGINIYVNGVLEQSVPVQTARSQSGQPLMIGNQPTFGPRLFNGLIDEAEIFDRELAAVEVQAIYSAGSAGKCRPYPTPRAIPTPRSRPTPRARPTPPPHITPVPPPPSPRPTPVPRPTPPPHLTPVPSPTSPRPTPAPRPRL
jgi:hypothetical protein